MMNTNRPPLPFLVFDFIDETNIQQRYAFSHPVKVISANCVEQIHPALSEVHDAVSQGYYAAGYLSYEAAPAFDPAFSVAVNPSLPLLWFGIFQKPDDKTLCFSEGEYRVTPWESETSQEEYNHAIEKIKDAIFRGETYQVNYTMRLRSKFDGDDLAFYNHLSQAQKAGYSAYLNIGRYRILSFSPELFFSLNGRDIVTRPMKGTVKRGRWQEEDESNAQWLRTSEKNQAENLMIVDLLRNDLSRISEMGSVQVPHLFEIERYPTVYQMTSTITAKLRPNLSLMEIFQALFPCGSITGAPKISTMRLISELEADPREIYCGTIGFIKPNGSAAFNVAIRTMFLDSETGAAEYGTGGGITWDSIDRDEYDEALTKADFLTKEYPPFELLETLKLDDGKYVLLDRHLDRLARSAQYFGITLDLQRAVKSLQEHAERYKRAARRVRLLVDRNGEVHVESSVLNHLGRASLPVSLAQTPISKDNIFLYHKTTNRSVYKYHRAQKNDVFDVLLWNENREITEFTNGNIVAEIAGLKLTPPKECGLLPGTFREKLLEEGRIQEKVLVPEDLRLATRIWLINSVRGGVLVHLTE